MRLQSYLAEGMDQKMTILDNAIPHIKKTSKPWLNIIKSNALPMYRGIEGISTVMRKKVRQNRRPKDTSFIEHDIADKAFERDLGWKARSQGLFITPSYTIAAGYGTVMLVFPIGKIKYLWSKEINDLFMYLKNTIVRNKWGTDDNPFVSNEDEKIKFATPEQLKKEITDKYRSTGVTKIRTGEVMVKCDEYWAIDTEVIYEYLYKYHDINIGGIERHSVFIKEVLL